MKNVFRTIIATLLISFIVTTRLAAQSSLLPELQAVRATLPTPMSPTQQATLLNTVALRHQSEGWGLLAKPNGNHCSLPTGVFIACDILVFRPTNQLFDVLQDGEGTGTPFWGGAQPLDDPSRFVSPVGTAPTPPAPKPPVPPVPNGDLAALKMQVARLDSEVGQLTVLVSTMKNEVAAQRDALNHIDLAVTELAARKIPATCKASVFGYAVSCKLE